MENHNGNIFNDNPIFWLVQNIRIYFKAKNKIEDTNKMMDSFMFGLPLQLLQLWP